MIEFNSSQIFLVTGASSGLGRAISIQLTQLGGKVLGIGRNEDELKKTSELCDSGLFVPIVRDLITDIDSNTKWVSELVKEQGKFSGIVLSAGIQHTLPLQAEKYQKMLDLFNINLFANISLAKGFAKKINNSGPGSSIVFLSSYTSLVGLGGLTAYSASKGAINSAVKTMAVELSKNGIRVNAVLPGHVKTELLEGNKSMIEALEPKYPLGLGNPEDVANLTSFLLSDKSKWITGALIPIDGGASIAF